MDALAARSRLRLTPIVLALPVLAFFAPMLFFGRALYLHDTSAYFYPYKALIGRALQSGRLPQWNPFAFGGMPLLVDPNFNAFHPLSLITDLFPTPWGYALFAAVNAWLAAWGTWLLARRLGLKTDACFVASLCYGWSGIFISVIEGGQFVAPSMLPWLLTAAVALAQAPSVRASVLMAFATAIMLLSGTPEVGTCGFLLSVLLALAVTDHGRPRVLLFLGAGVTAGLLLAAVQVIPTWLFLRHSSRAGGWSFREASDFSLHPLRLLNFAFPFFSGDTNAPGGAYWIAIPAMWRPYVAELYAGVLPLLLAAAGIIANQRRTLRWMAFATALLVIVSFGRFTPVFGWVRDIVPPFRGIRFPEKFVIPSALTIALLAGAGWSVVWSWSGWRRPLRVATVLTVASIAVVGAINARLPAMLGPGRTACLRHTFLPSLILELSILTMALAVLHWRERLPRPRVLVGALLLIELGWPAVRLDRTIPAREITQSSPVVAWLAKDSGTGPAWSWRFDMESRARIADIDQSGEPSWSRSRKLHFLRHAALYGAQPALEGLYNLRGYSGFTSGTMKAIVAGSSPRHMMNFLGVRYGITYGQGGGALYEKLGFKPFASSKDGEIRIWKNAAAEGKVHLFDAVLAGSQAGLVQCGSLDAIWMPADEAAQLPPGLPVVRDCAHLPASRIAGASSQLIRYEPELVTARITTPAPSVVVLNDATGPGWHVSVDGAPALSLAADGALRAVAVSKGTHEVDWRYETPGLRLGAILSGLTLLLLVGAFIRR